MGRSSDPTALIHYRTREVVADAVEMATTRAERRRGLLGRDRLDERAALMLSPCVAIHTVGMTFPIDVAFVDRHGVAVRLVHRLGPWRLAASTRAHAAIELAAGRLERCGVQVGDRLCLDPPC